MSDVDPCRVFRKLAYNNALANLRLQRACENLQAGEFEAARTSFFPSIKATLNHILVVDWFYVDALEGGRLGPRAWQIEEPCETLAQLIASQADVDRRLTSFCDDLSAERLGDPVELYRGERVQRERIDDVLSHLFQHQTHHRGQVHAMLAGTSVRPPQLDEFIVADDAVFREGELGALSWSETMLMR